MSSDAIKNRLIKPIIKCYISLILIHFSASGHQGLASTLQSLVKIVNSNDPSMVAVSSKKKSITRVIFDVDGLLLGKQSLNCKLHAQFHPLYGEQLDSCCYWVLKSWIQSLMQ